MEDDRMTQKQVLEVLKTGENIFLTGEPGSGKTHLINEYVAYLRSCGIEPAITASTGIAATHISGVTLHSWSGIGVSDWLSPDDLAIIAGRKKIRKNIGEANVLIIDEVSMLSGPTLSMAEAVCREVKENDLPFGGLQVILTGDFFQLPPVSRDGTRIPFAYESEAWLRLNPAVCYLTEQYRQKDRKFLAVLAAIRSNQCDDSHRGLIMTRLCLPENLPKDIPRLFPHNINVDQINSARLIKLPGQLFSFPMETAGPRPLVESLKKNCLSPEFLELKKGAAVMFTKNNQQGRFVNGTLGKIIGFGASTGQPIVETRDGSKISVESVEWAIEEGGRKIAKISQMPLRLAWAITVHKSQGMSMDEAAVDLSAAFEYGQGYVAFSRVRALAGLYLLGINDRAFTVHPEVLEKDREFRIFSERTIKKLEAMSKRSLLSVQRHFMANCGGRLPK
ncbi:MAG: PIF1 family DEAD/DEAH box helicase [bacterium]|nr:PIF1 family DEAD/DEAH box helicase [bacterium]